jgi:site-specific DNA-methyltransferase (adenine-specific)
MNQDNTPIPQFVQTAVIAGSGLFISNECNMTMMSRYADNYFDLAIVDPPYGIDMDGGNIGGNNATKATNYTKKDWDKSSPDVKYFKELIRVSKNQIIWGANHFIQDIPKANSSCWVIWDKQNTGNFADCEMAWTSFDTAVRKFEFRWNGMLQGDMKNKEVRIHPTQKPVKLYEWVLNKYAKVGDKILDTHLGSGSIAIAVDSINKIEKMNLTLTACELDKEYFDNSITRIKDGTNWQSLF